MQNGRAHRGYAQVAPRPLRHVQARCSLRRRYALPYLCFSGDRDSCPLKQISQLLFSQEKLLLFSCFATENLMRVQNDNPKDSRNTSKSTRQWMTETRDSLNACRCRGAWQTSC